MSKDLEREYRAFVDSGAPNLWDRIESGLEDKTISSTHGKKISYKVWAGLIAACVCVALIVPAMTMRMGVGFNNTASNNTAQNRAAESYEEALCEEAAEEAGGDAMDIVTLDGACTNADIDGAGLETAEMKPYHFTATVEIIDTDVRMDSGILYTAKVIAAKDAALSEDSEIKIFSSAVPSGNVVALEISHVYNLTLKRDFSQEMWYILVDIDRVFEHSE